MTPLYLSILEALRNDIREGRYLKSFPSESQLVRRFSVGRQTVIRAMSDAKICTKMMMMKNTDEAIADVMTDGCDMGIKSLHKYMNKYKNADRDAMSVAKRLVASEEYLENKLRDYL